MAKIGLQPTQKHERAVAALMRVSYRTSFFCTNEIGLEITSAICVPNLVNISETLPSLVLKRETFVTAEVCRRACALTTAVQVVKRTVISIFTWEYMFQIR